MTLKCGKVERLLFILRRGTNRIDFNLNGKMKLVDSAGEITDTGNLEDYKTVQIGLAASATYYIHKVFFC